MNFYNARRTGYFNISHLLIYVKGIKDTEKKPCENNAKRRKKFNKNWKNWILKRRKKFNKNWKNVLRN